MAVTLIPFPRKGNFTIKTNFQHKSMGKIESAFYFGTEEVSCLKSCIDLKSLIKPNFLDKSNKKPLNNLTSQSFSLNFFGGKHYFVNCNVNIEFAFVQLIFELSQNTSMSLLICSIL